MSSVIGQQFRQVTVNALYVNLVGVQSTIYDSNNNVVQWGNGLDKFSILALLSTPGAALFRDMGKNVYVPDPNTNTTVGSQSSILRKVQLVTNAGTTALPNSVGGYYGTGDNNTSDFFQGYLRLGGQIYGGGTGVASGFVRLN